ncbi:MAG: type II toxin-antitoxin system RelE/ParE family toxin [Actinobacteria bacterium]|nr:type II toxin-antitoxin system RelE/ParE family toxin [Actinomycetota bacterium]
MAYRIEVSPAAARQLKKIDRRVLYQIAEKIDSLASEPRPHGCEKLRGYDNLYRVRVGSYRIVYGVEDRLVVVVVLKAGNRADIYQRIRESDLDFLRSLISK